MSKWKMPRFFSGSGGSDPKARILEEGEIGWDRDAKRPRIGDGSRTGGYLLATDRDIIPLFKPENYGATVYATRAAAIAGTDSTAAFKSMIAACYAAGGGTIQLSGWYRLTEGLLLPNTNTAADIGSQPPMSFVGIGAQATYVRPTGGCGMVWTADGPAPVGVLDPVAKIDTRGRGQLYFENIILASSEGSGNTKPFVYTTFTTVKTGKNVCIDGAVWGAGADEDAFVMGGTYPHEADTGFDRRSADCGFQGYGTNISDVYCNGVRRLAVLQRYANAIRICNNTVWSTCGNDSATGGAIEIDGTPAGLTGYAVGAVITGNLIEITHYKYAVHLKHASAAFIAGNDCYDATALSVAGVYVDATCDAIRIVASLAPSTRPYVSDPGNIALIFGQEFTYYDKVNSIIARGDPTYPNKLGPTIFTSGANFIQPTAPLSENGAYLALKRPVDAASSPNAIAYQISGNGLITYGDANSASSGNVTVSAPGQAEYWSQGRMWGFNGRTGQNMGHNTGTGGSTYTARQSQFILIDHTSTTVGRISNTNGGAGLPGIAFGSSYDAEIYRASAGAIAVSLPVRLKSYTVATLPAAATAGAGAVAYCTDLNATTTGSIVAGGGSNKGEVISDGTNWRIVAAW